MARKPKTTAKKAKKKRPSTPRPTRPEPISQGSLGEMYRHFFGPLLAYRPHEMEVREWLDYLFDLPNRDVVRFTSTQAFTMPGLFWCAPHVRVQSLGDRSIEPAQEIYVRFDARNPGTLDAEIIGIKGTPDQTFTITDKDWLKMKPFLMEAERKRKP